MLYIIDGYNLFFEMFNNEIKENEEDVNFDAYREKIISLVDEFLALKSATGIIIFDAYKTNAKKETVLKSFKSHRYLDIVFTKKDESADSYIEKMDLQDYEKESVFIVTGDGALQNMLFNKGVLRISSREFVKILLKEKKQLRSMEEIYNNKNKNTLFKGLNEDISTKLELIRRRKWKK